MDSRDRRAYLVKALVPGAALRRKGDAVRRLAVGRQLGLSVLGRHRGGSIAEVSLVTARTPKRGGSVAFILL